MWLLVSWLVWNWHCRFFKAFTGFYSEFSSVVLLTVVCLSRYCFLFLVLQPPKLNAQSHWFPKMEVTLASSSTCSSLSSYVTSYSTFLWLSYQLDCSSLRSHYLLVYTPYCLLKFKCSQLLAMQYPNKYFVNTFNSLYLSRVEDVHPIL